MFAFGLISVDEFLGESLCCCAWVLVPFPRVLAHCYVPPKLEERLASKGLPCPALGYLGERMNVCYSIKTGRAGHGWPGVGRSGLGPAL